MLIMPRPLPRAECSSSYPDEGAFLFVHLARLR